MNINSVNNLSFRAEVSQRFLAPAKRHLENATYRQQSMFEDNVAMFENMPNTEGIIISYERVRENGEMKHALVAQKGDKKVTLSVRDDVGAAAAAQNHFLTLCAVDTDGGSLAQRQRTVFIF